MEPAASQPAEAPVNLAGALGTDAGVATQCFTVYVPNKDKNDQVIGTQRRWVLDAIRLLSEVNGGATAIPVEGGWLNDEGKIISGTPGPHLLLRHPTGRVPEKLAAPPRSCIRWAGKPTRERSPSSSTAASTASDSSTRLKESIMAKRIHTPESTVNRIHVSEPATPRLDPRVVADALGAESCPERLEGQPGPVTLYALRQELIRRRQSSGGRPGIEGTSFRAKIPLNDQDWQRAEALAAALSAEGFSPSAGQVASVLLSIALRSVTPDPKEEAQEHVKHTAALARELATRLKAEKTR
jgi:hypothetical protein